MTFIQEVGLLSVSILQYDGSSISHLVHTNDGAIDSPVVHLVTFIPQRSCGDCSTRSFG